MKAYTGIGSRETPTDILHEMEEIAKGLAQLGWTLRSGCAPGADSAFEAGARTAGGAMELYLPWPTFGSRSDATRPRPQEEAYEIAARFHPAWSRLKPGGRMLHARNVHQVLGYDVTQPEFSHFIVCWTRGGKGGGGTGQALRIAAHYEIPIYDLARLGHLEGVTAMLPAPPAVTGTYPANGLN